MFGIIINLKSDTAYIIGIFHLLFSILQIFLFKSNKLKLNVAFLEREGLIYLQNYKPCPGAQLGEGQTPPGKKSLTGVYICLLYTSDAADE